MAKSNLTAKTLMLGHKVSDTYGKANVLDLITINTNLTSATVTAGGVAKLGDFVHVFPFLSGNVGGVSVIGETLVLNVSRFVDRIGLKTQKVTVTFTDVTGWTKVDTDYNDVTDAGSIVFTNSTTDQEVTIVLTDVINA